MNSVRVFASLRSDIVSVFLMFGTIRFWLVVVVMLRFM